MRCLTPTHADHRISLAVDARDVIDSVLSSSVITTSLHDWINVVLQHRDQLLECRIDSLEHRKNQNGVKHEYVDLTLQCTGRSGMRYSRHIRIDRSFQRNSIDVQSHYRTLLRGGGLPADDTVIIAPTPYHTASFSLYAAYFHGAQRPTLLDLVAVLQAVSSLAPSYHLYTMCYWHAYMVFRGLAQRFDGRIEKGYKPVMRGVYKWPIRVIEKDDRLVLTGLRLLPWSCNFLELPTFSEVLGCIEAMRTELSQEEQQEVITEHPIEVRTFMTLQSKSMNLLFSSLGYFTSFQQI